MTEKRWTTIELIKWTTGYFESKGLSSPRVDAEILLAWVLECERMDLYTRWDRPVSEDERDRFRDTVRRRASGEPVQYITGEQPFHDLKVRVDRRVLIPRPETEWLVERLFETVQPSGSEKPCKVLDVGTGSGAIACALASGWPMATVWAVDVSRGALDLARVNAETAGVAERLHFLEGDLLQPVAEKTSFFDIVVANLPYIPSPSMKSLPREVRDFEPTLALDGGDDGFRYAGRMLEEVAMLTAPFGWLALELDHTTMPLAVEVLKRSGDWETVRAENDLTDKPRAVFAQKSR